MFLKLFPCKSSIILTELFITYLSTYLSIYLSIYLLRKKQLKVRGGEVSLVLGPGKYPHTAKNDPAESTGWGGTAQS